MALYACKLQDKVSRQALHYCVQIAKKHLPEDCVVQIEDDADDNVSPLTTEDSSPISLCSRCENHSKKKKHACSAGRGDRMEEQTVAAAASGSQQQSRARQSHNNEKEDEMERNSNMNKENVCQQSEQEDPTDEEEEVEAEDDGNLPQPQSRKKRHKSSKQAFEKRLDVKLEANEYEARFKAAFKEATDLLQRRRNLDVVTCTTAGSTGASTIPTVPELVKQMNNKFNLNGKKKLSKSTLYRAIHEGKVGRSPCKCGRQPKIPDFFLNLVATHAEVRNAKNEIVSELDVHSDEVRSRIINMDETHHDLLITGDKGGSRALVYRNPNLQRGFKATAKPGRHVTVVYATNSAGEALPPMYIFDSGVKIQSNFASR